MHFQCGSIVISDLQNQCLLIALNSSPTLQPLCTASQANITLHFYSYPPAEISFLKASLLHSSPLDIKLLSKISVCRLLDRTFLTGGDKEEGFNHLTWSWYVIKGPQSITITLFKLNRLARKIAKTLKPKSHDVFVIFFPTRHALQWISNSSEFNCSECNELNLSISGEKGLGT